MTREIFAKGLAMLSAAFLTPRGLSVDEATAEAYWVGLGDLAATDYRAACVRAIKECKFMPVPAELLAYARAERQGNALVEATDRKVAELRAWRADPRLLEAIRETVNELATAKDANAALKDE